MKINLTSVLVDDQDKALRFYTEVLGFVKKMDMPAGKFKKREAGMPPLTLRV
jgi:catechol 2,3-dioxygenase-like lactoylglutathione lyase family enzyme